MAKNGDDWGLEAVTAGWKRAGQKPDFYERYVGEISRPRPGLAPVRWLDARPSVFWNLPEREFAAALAERRAVVRVGGSRKSPDVCERCCSAASSAVE
jgi:hypothetical protein